MSLICSVCGKILFSTESCPSCGQRQFTERVEERFRIGEILKLKGYKGGMSKRKGLMFEIFQGWDFSVDRGYFVYKYREINKRDDLYIEEVIDKNAGETLRKEKESLSKHIERGSAKQK